MLRIIVVDRHLLFLVTEEAVEGKNALLLGMSQWNSNDLVEQIETIGKLEENQGTVLVPSSRSANRSLHFKSGAQQRTHNNNTS